MKVFSSVASFGSGIAALALCTLLQTGAASASSIQRSPAPHPASSIHHRTTTPSDCGNMSTAPYKFTLTHYRRPEHTHEEFINWIVTVHLPLGLPVMQKHGITDYALFVTPADLNDALKAQVQPINPTWQFADYDVIIEYKLPSPDTITQVMSDPDWQKAVADQDQWVDVPRALLSLGFETAYLQNGKIINMPA